MRFPGARTWTLNMDVTDGFEQRRQGLGLVVLQRLEEHALFPPDVVIEQLAHTLHQSRVRRDDVGLPFAALGQSSKHTMLGEELLPQRGAGAKREEQALFVGKVLANLAAPSKDERIDRVLPLGDPLLRGPHQVAGLDQTVHMLTRQGLECLVTLERWS